MIVKIFKGVWLLSLLATLVIFLYVYASLPEDIELSRGEAVPAFTLSRTGLFYLTLAILSFFNLLVFVFARLFRKNNELFAAWFYGLVTFLHLFLIVALQFFNLYNSLENYNYESIGYIIYGSIGLVVTWFSLWPVYFIYGKFFNKPAI